MERGCLLPNQNSIVLVPGRDHAGALVPQRKGFPDNSVDAGTPAQLVRDNCAPWRVTMPDMRGPCRARSWHEGRSLLSHGSSWHLYSRVRIHFVPNGTSFAPAWLARDMRLMLEGFHKHGMAAKPETISRLSNLLGHAPRSYRAFAAETAQAWRR